MTSWLYILCRLPISKGTPKSQVFSYNPAFWVLFDFPELAIPELLFARTISLQGENTVIHYIYNFFSKPYLENGRQSAERTRGDNPALGREETTRRRYPTISLYVCPVDSLALPVLLEYNPSKFTNYRLKFKIDHDMLRAANRNLNFRRNRMKKYFLPLIMLTIFETVAATLWLTKNNIFYLFNFSYIGISISLGVFLFIKKYRYARRVAQLLVGLYMLVYLGFICGENMQIEGFWYYLFTGVFEAATIHYAVAKIFGPLLFGRGWCGYACWTAMVLDFLPYKIPETPRKKIGWVRYITFAISFIFVSTLFLSHIGNLEKIMFWAFIIGNVMYYIVGIILAFAFKDNRAFCKYVCPITIFLKPMSYFSLLRIKCDKRKCISCGKCKNVCPMEVDVTDNSRKRKNGTECILCFECVKNCPRDAL